MDLPALTARYRADGVVTLPALLAPAEVAEVRREYGRYAREIAPTLGPADVTFEADNRTVRNLWRLEQHDAWFAAFAQQPRLLELAAALANGRPLLVAVETFNKPARVGSAVPPHQDNAYFCQTPPDMFTLWIALDPATAENGPVTYVRGSHHDGVRPHRPSGVRGNSFGLAEPPTPAPGDLHVGLLAAGDALAHHCQTIHYSAPNRSAHPRLGLLLVYRGTHTQTDPAMKRAYDEARRLAGMA